MHVDSKTVRKNQFKYSSLTYVTVDESLKILYFELFLV